MPGYAGQARESSRLDHHSSAQSSRRGASAVRGASATVQRQEVEPSSQSAPAAAVNDMGLPDGLRAGVERLSGISMADVKVHYNSSKPAQWNAYAFAQGTDIHLGPGQEKHLPHEAWHVVQQKQGRVRPTFQMKGMGVNDDVGLEREADVMGRKTMMRNDGLDSGFQAGTLTQATFLGRADNHSFEPQPTPVKNINNFGTRSCSRSVPVQCKIGYEVEFNAPMYTADPKDDDFNPNLPGGHKIRTYIRGSAGLKPTKAAVSKSGKIAIHYDHWDDDPTYKKHYIAFVKSICACRLWDADGPAKNFLKPELVTDPIEITASGALKNDPLPHLDAISNGIRKSLYEPSNFHNHKLGVPRNELALVRAYAEKQTQDPDGSYANLARAANNLAVYGFASGRFALLQASVGVGLNDIPRLTNALLYNYSRAQKQSDPKKTKLTMTTYGLGLATIEAIMADTMDNLAGIEGFEDVGIGQLLTLKGFVHLCLWDTLGSANMSLTGAIGRNEEVILMAKDSFALLPRNDAGMLYKSLPEHLRMEPDGRWGPVVRRIVELADVALRKTMLMIRKELASESKQYDYDKVREKYVQKLEALLFGTDANFGQLGEDQVTKLNHFDKGLYSSANLIVELRRILGTLIYASPGKVGLQARGILAQVFEILDDAIADWPFPDSWWPEL